jgi:hypothetical protein
MKLAVFGALSLVAVYVAAMLLSPTPQPQWVAPPGAKGWVEEVRAASALADEVRAEEAARAKQAALDAAREEAWLLAPSEGGKDQ